jgi:hypothetical protein
MSGVTFSVRLCAVIPATTNEAFFPLFFAEGFLYFKV